MMMTTTMNKKKTRESKKQTEWRIEKERKKKTKRTIAQNVISKRMAWHGSHHSHPGDGAFTENGYRLKNTRELVSLVKFNFSSLLLFVA